MWVSGPAGERVTYSKGRFRPAFTLESGIGPVAEDDDGLIWEKQGRRQRLVDGKMVPIPLPDSVPQTIWTTMADTGTGQWIGSRKEGLWHLSESGVVRRFNSGDVRPLLQQRDGTLWVVGVSPGGIARLDGDRWVSLTRPGDATRFQGRFAYEGADGSAWFQTNSAGVVRYKHGVTETFSTEEGLSDARINDLLVDPSGVVWVSTDAGLDRLRPAPFAPLDPTRQLPARGVTLSATQDKSGAIWFVGLNSDTVTLIDGGIVSSKAEPLRVRRMGEGRVIGPGANGGVWLKGLGKDLVFLSTTGERRVVGARHGFAEMRINGVLDAPDGALWIERLGGLGVLRNGRFRNVVIDGDSSIAANAYTVDRRGQVWLAWNDQSQLVVFQGDSIVRRVSVPMEHVDYLAVEGIDTVWAASEYGVVRIIGDSAVKVAIPGAERVLVSRLSLAVGQGGLWISSYGGIARMSLRQLHAAADGGREPVTLQLFSELDGLPAAGASRIEWKSIWTGPDGRIWISTSGGIAVSNPAYQPDSSVPRLLDQMIRANGRQVGEHYPMPARPRRIEIGFTATGMQLPERARLQYQLVGVDSQWVDAPATRVASYDGLPRGAYQFKLRGWNGDGIPTTEQAVMGFQVKPAWNQAWWFYGLIIIALQVIAGVVAVLWQRRRLEQTVMRERAEFDRLLLERKQHYEATLAERSRIAQDLHDTLLQGFAGVTLQLKAAELALPDSPEVAAETILRTQLLARDSLREARERVWEMKDSNLRGEELAGALERVGRERSSGTGIAVSVRVDGVHRSLPDTVEDAAFRIGREAIVNAVRHAGASTITVTLAYEPSALRLTVEDDGRGFSGLDAETARQNGHFGVSGMRDRAEHVGGRCEVRAAEGGGTIVTVELPC